MGIRGAVSGLSLSDAARGRRIVGGQAHARKRCTVALSGTFLRLSTFAIIHGHFEVCNRPYLQSSNIKVMASLFHKSEEVFKGKLSQIFMIMDRYTKVAHLMSKHKEFAILKQYKPSTNRIYSTVKLKLHISKRTSRSWRTRMPPIQRDSFTQRIGELWLTQNLRRRGVNNGARYNRSGKSLTITVQHTRILLVLEYC